MIPWRRIWMVYAVTARGRKSATPFRTKQLAETHIRELGDGVIAFAERYDLNEGPPHKVVTGFRPK